MQNNHSGFNESDQSYEDYGQLKDYGQLEDYGQFSDHILDSQEQFSLPPYYNFRCMENNFNISIHDYNTFQDEQYFDIVQENNLQIAEEVCNSEQICNAESFRKHNLTTTEQVCNSEQVCNAELCRKHNIKANKQVCDSKSVCKRKQCTKSIRKNFPKTIGIHLIRHFKKHPNQNIPLGIQKILQRANDLKNAKKQLSFAIQDFRNACQSDIESQEYLKDFIKNKLWVYLSRSTKISDIEPYEDLINNAYLGTCNPDIWVGNAQISSSR